MLISHIVSLPCPCELYGRYQSGYFHPTTTRIQFFSPMTVHCIHSPLYSCLFIIFYELYYIDIDTFHFLHDVYQAEILARVAVKLERGSIHTTHAKSNRQTTSFLYRTNMSPSHTINHWQDKTHLKFEIVYTLSITVYHSHEHLKPTTVTTTIKCAYSVTTPTTLLHSNQY